MSKCFGCLFKAAYRDHGWSADVCLREKDFDKAMEACKDDNCSLDCEYHITSEQLSDLLDVIKKHQFVNVALVKLELKEFLEIVYGTDCCSRLGSVSSELMKLVDGLPMAKFR